MSEPTPLPATTTPANNSRSGWPSFAMLVAAALLLAALFYAWQQWRQLQQQLIALDRGLSAQQEQLVAQEKHWQYKMDVLTQEIIQLKSADRSDWLLAETEYLLRLANQQAILGRDAPAAAALLSEADQVLKELAQPSALVTFSHMKKISAIRQQIAEEREALVLRGDIDRDGIYLRIEALVKQLEKTPVIDLDNMSRQTSSLVVTEENEIAPVSVIDRVLKSLRLALEKIGGYVRIRQHEDALQKLLSPGEQLYLKQNLIFMLEQAQIAALQQQQPVYANSLAKAREWITEYYVMDPELKKKLLAELGDLASYNVEQPLPDISGSLGSLKALMKLHHQQGMAE